MSLSSKALLPILILAAAIGWWALRRAGDKPSPTPSPLTVETSQEPAVPEVPTAPPRVPSTLAALGSAPNWSALDAFQDSITRADFERLLTTIFTTGEAWRSFIAISDQEAVITTDSPKSGMRFHLRFAATGTEKQAPRHWRSVKQLPPAPVDRPLEGLKIAIDPGHIGGEWAKMEERWFSVGGAPAVCEGDLTLRVARILKPKLEALGATVSLVRNSPEPLTTLRPESLLSQASDSSDSGADLRKVAERLFYRTAEIRARADLVNQTLKPDLVLCLHFNADPWGNANKPALVDRTHFHLLLNGGYTDDEVVLSDQRFELLRKLLQRTHEEEAAVGADVAAAFYSAAGLPAYTYNAAGKNARTVDGNPFLWARNLLANRLYDCPVIFMEPYVMNSKHDYARIQAGDYEGLRDIGGKKQPSIFREYADALTDGLKKHYTKFRPAPTPPDP